MSEKKIITRFAPSPTGFLHMGGVRTAFFNYLFARQNNGIFILRIEDTDKERSKEEWTQGLVNDLAWLGIEHDIFAKQSERVELHTQMLKKMIDKGFAYEAEESEKGSGKVIRFKNPNKKILFQDLVRGEVSVDTTDLGDFVIARNINEPLYHLAVVIDDADMNVTHVIRAEEHLSNTPRQILLLEALGFTRPIYAHLPLVLASDRSKLSKRKHGETVSLTYYREKGYCPEAILNFIALLGWNPGDDREILSKDDLIKEFNIEKVQKGGAIFNVLKLDWINHEYLKNMDSEKRSESVKEYLNNYKKPNWRMDGLSQKIIDLIAERIKKWSDIKEMIESGELDYFFEEPKLDREKIVWKKDNDESQAIKHLEKASQIVEVLQDEEYNDKIIKDKLMSYAEESGKGSVLWPIRYALTAKERSPDPFILAEILGKEETLKRWKRAISILK